MTFYKQPGYTGETGVPRDSEILPARIAEARRQIDASLTLPGELLNGSDDTMVLSTDVLPGDLFNDPDTEELPTDVAKQQEQRALVGGYATATTMHVARLDTY